MELENASVVRTEQIAADKRTIELQAERIKEIEQPAYYLKEQVKISEMAVTKSRAECQDIKLQLTTYKQLCNSTEKENFVLKKQKKHVEELNTDYEARMKVARAKMDDVA